MRVLIAEDGFASRKILEKYLTSWGFEVISCTNGLEAWTLLQEDNPPKLLILDWMMPGLDGTDLCLRVRNMKKTLNPSYIILLTARTKTENIVDGLEAGANDYITKPFDENELRARINVGIRVLKLQEELANNISDLEKSLEEIKTLRGILPICSYCKNIRDDQNYWQKVENYISKHSEAAFSHSICPDCYVKHIQPQLDKLDK